MRIDLQKRDPYAMKLKPHSQQLISSSTMRGPETKKSFVAVLVIGIIVFIVIIIIIIPIIIFGTEDGHSDSAHFWCHKTMDGVCQRAVEDNFTRDEMRQHVRKIISGGRRAATGVRGEG